MIEITHFSEDYKNVHFKSLFKGDLKIEVLIYKESDLLTSFNIDVTQMSEYWISINETLKDKKIVFLNRDTKKELLVKSDKKCVGLVEVWLGKIPDYFQYHVETIGTLSCVDFYFFTDDREYDFSKIKHENFHLNYIDDVEFLNRFNNISNVKIDKIASPKKIIDFKLAYFEMFSDYIGNYPYVGIYDIDTLFGDINQTILDSIGYYDFISVGDEVFHNRLSGPLMIVRNEPEFHNLMKTDRYYETLLWDEIYGYGEQELSTIAVNEYKTKLIYSMNTETNNGGKNTYNVRWGGGKLIVNDEEKLLYHFIRKNHTIFQKVGNQIFGRYDKMCVEDFYWVFGFTENYSKTIPYLMDSIDKYSNRKCVIYSINFDYNIPQKFLTSGQFIFKRIDIPEGKKDERGRDENIISCKPKLMLDVLNFLPNKNFIFIDSDVSLTVVADDIGRYFSKLKNYPLINSHTHDKIYLTNLVEGEEWSSTIDIIANKVGVEVCVFPRRKTNIMLFDKNSKWFFEEQIHLYETYKNSEPGIFAFHDEDSANLLLSKYKLHDCLHLCDIEECDDIDMNKFTDTNHPFHLTGLSEYLVLPTHQNDVVFFHGLKDECRFKSIEKIYGNTVLDCEEILVTYVGDTIFFEKNSFLKGKNILNEVDFKVYDLKGNLITELNNQLINNYWTFYLSDIHLNTKEIAVKINESENGRTIYRNVIKIK